MSLPPHLDVGVASRAAEALQTAVNKPEYEPFCYQIDKNLYSDYYCLVAAPIDLELIISRLKYGYYRQEEALEQDIRMVHENCELYNDADSEVVHNAKLLVRELNDAIWPERRDLLPQRDNDESSADGFDDMEDGGASTAHTASPEVEKTIRGVDLPRRRETKIILTAPKERRSCRLTMPAEETNTSDDDSADAGDDGSGNDAAEDMSSGGECDYRSDAAEEVQSFTKRSSRQQEKKLILKITARSSRSSSRVSSQRLVGKAAGSRGFNYRDDSDEDMFNEDDFLPAKKKAKRAPRAARGGDYDTAASTGTKPSVYFLKYKYITNTYPNGVINIII